MPLRFDHVGITVTDLEQATAFFVELGFVVEGEAAVGGEWVDRVIGLVGVKSDIVMLKTPDGFGHIELSRFRSPLGPEGDALAASNTPGLRHLSFEVDDLAPMIERLRERGAELIGDLQDYQDIYRLCYLRGPDGIIVELAERIG